MGENCRETENCLIDEERTNRTYNIDMENPTYDPMSAYLVTSTIAGLNASYERDYNATAAPNDASQTSLGVLIAVFLCTLLIFVVIFGNTLVILSVVTTRRLRTVTNLFVMSLAVADLLVGIFVMPLDVALTLSNGESSTKVGKVLHNTTGRSQHK